MYRTMTVVSFAGKRENGSCEVSVVLRDGPSGAMFSGPLPHCVLHSPTGMEWGYGGSGPADLAASILAFSLGLSPGTVEAARVAAPCPHVIQDRACTICRIPESKVQALEDAREVLGLYQPFKALVVEGLREDDWILPAADVVAWIHRRRLVVKGASRA